MWGGGGGVDLICTTLYEMPNVFNRPFSYIRNIFVFKPIFR